MDWKFRHISPNEVESEITQRDQFSNDSVELVDALGREVTQNTQDAIDIDRGETSSRLVFRFSNDIDPTYFRSLFEGAEKHLESSGVDLDQVDWNEPTALIIEDFGTTGLTGSYEIKDKQNFSDFWRRHGRSHKGGTNLGRWGLGKLVYSYTSQLRVFFGLTKRSNDPLQLLMGQAVLNNHTIDGEEFAPHGFFAEQPGDIQIPSTDTFFIQKFKNELGLTRENESGLSVIIPFPSRVITPNRLLEGLILNYFFPILSENLVIDVDGEIVKKSNIREMTEKYANSKIRDAGTLFDFIEGVHDFDNENLIRAKIDWQTSGKMSDTSFIPIDLLNLRAKFDDGELIGVRFPITVTKDGEAKATSFNVFIQKPEELTSGRDMYVRGSLLIPSEAKFSHRRALGVLMAKDKPITSFLGDAENPAHTKWNGNAEKLKPYTNAAPNLRAIRNSIVQLHDLLAQSMETETDDPLKRFFSIPGTGKKTHIKKRRNKIPPPPPPPPPPIPKPVKVEKFGSGFRLIPNEPIDPNDFPITAKIRAAYNRPDGSAFRKYSPLDFDFGSSDFSIEGRQISLTSKKNNLIEFQIVNDDFELDVQGFDDKREPIVKVEI